MFPQYLTNTLHSQASLNGGTETLWSSSDRDYLIKIYRLFDVIAAVTSLVTVFTVMNLGKLPAGLAGFLTMRITVKNLLLLFCFSFLWQSVFKLFRLYDLATIRSYREEAWRLLAACSLGSFCAIAFPLASTSGAFSYHMVPYFFGVVITATVLTRHLVHALTPGWTPLGPQARRLLIVGSGPRALKLYRSIIGQSNSDYKFIGFVDSRTTQEVDATIAMQLVGSLKQLQEILASRIVDEVLIALPIKSCYEQIQETIQTCEEVGVDCKYLSDIFQVSVAKARFERNEHYSIVSMKMAIDDYRLLVKRAIDIVGALSALIMLSPVLLVTAIAIKLTSSGPIVFTQQRHGFGKRRFKMYKFRTMVQNAESLQAQLEHKNEAQGPIFKIKNDPRITPVGRFLRKTSIDELPQLVNVLLGDMSLVGPRPMSERDVALFSEPRLMRRFSVKPGLTCLWQINGRSNTNFDFWISQDLKYIDNWSLGLDLAILLKTVPAVVKGHGAV